MRKLLLLTAIAVCIITMCSKAQYVDIPDPAFRSFLRNNYGSCMNAQGQLDTTCSQILAVEDLLYQPFGGCQSDALDLTGLQYFKSLKRLDISGLTCLQTFPYISTLKYLYGIDCGPVKLSALPNGLKGFVHNWFYSFSSTERPPFINDNGHLPDSLEFLSLHNCNRENPFSLPLLPRQLKYLDITSVNVDSLPLLPASLNYLNCDNNYGINNLRELPPGLLFLSCFNTRVGRLPALPDSLRSLSTGLLEFLPALPEKLNFLSTGVLAASSFPALPSGIDTIKLFGCNLPGIGQLPDSLVYFDCNNTAISSFLNFPGKLEYVNLDFNTSLTSLPDLPASLKNLYSTNNPLITLGSIATATNLTNLTISQSQLTTLPPLPASLRVLNCEDNNRLANLPSSAGSVDSIICRNNALLSLPMLTNRVKLLDCSSNQLSSLPLLPDSLIALVFHNNQVTSIPALPQSIQLLGTYGNPVNCLPALPPGIFVVDLDPSIRCVPNTPAFCYFMPGITGPFNWGFDWLGSPFWLGNNVQMPLCNPTNNVNGCQSFPVISGNVFYDINNNGIKDTGEYDKEGARIHLNNSITAFSNRTGYFEIASDKTGSSSITVEPVLFYNTVPSTAAYNFTSYDTIVSKSYALQPNQVKDSITLKLIPLNWAARPGFAYPYLISLDNIGTTLLNPAMTVQYDNTKLTYDSSDVALINNGSSLSFSTNNFTPGQKQNIIAYFRVKPTAVLGDTIITQANIIANSQNNTAAFRTRIGGAFDPNDKQATPQLSPLQVANGEYIDYTIRFQNTGTDTAFNIVITDTLNSNLKAGTLQMLASSHNCKATVDSNVVYLEFLNILLPDSNVNEPLSHGFVSFRIQPESSVAVNTIIPNNAAIYFDYNAPVITNTAGTLIKDFTVVPLRLISFSAAPQNDNTTTLYWNTANEINTKHFVIERSNDGLRFTAITNIVAKGKANNNYNTTIAEANTGIIFFRLRIVDNDGSFTYSPIIKIDKRKNAAGFSILSNPVKSFLVISTTDRTLNNTQANIINMQGAVVKTFIMREGSQTVEVKDLPAGIYYLKTINGSRMMIR